MCDTLFHRGPDDSGSYIAGAVGLGARRLSIVDLVHGQQPIHNEDSSIWIVFNGEIYNFVELRQDLLRRGHVFYTASDTEVVVHAYEEFGTGCFNRLRGMFAIALWDSRQATLVLAVDRFGIKPIYFGEGPRGVVFGSEIKSLLASGMVSRTVDFDGLGQYFTFGYVAGPCTAFTEARKLAPGCFLQWNAGTGSSIEQYWDWPADRVRNDRSVQTTCPELREALRDAVQAHLTGDVPLGAFLSGGIDSSTIVAFMADTWKEGVETFSIGFSDRESDESVFARSVAKHFNTTHHELIIEPESVDCLPRLVSAFDEPFADSSALATYYLSKMAREHVKVALSGDGGDELFLGYTIFQGLEVARWTQALPAQLRRVAATLTGTPSNIGQPTWDEWMTRWRKRASDTVLAPDFAYGSKIALAGRRTLWELLSRDLRGELEQRNPFVVIDEALARCPVGKESHPLDRYVYAGIKVSLPADMLTKVDRMSMANSLEVRVPFLDHVLAEFAATIPTRTRLLHGQLKGLLRKAMADKLPAEILRRPKHGFSVPLRAWFRDDIHAYAEAILLSGDARGRGFLDIAAVERFLRRPSETTGSQAQVIWCLLVFELWCSLYLGG